MSHEDVGLTLLRRVLNGQVPVSSLKRWLSSVKSKAPDEIVVDGNLSHIEFVSALLSFLRNRASDLQTNCSGINKIKKENQNTTTGNTKTLKSVCSPDYKNEFPELLHCSTKKRSFKCIKRITPTPLPKAEEEEPKKQNNTNKCGSSTNITDEQKYQYSPRFQRNKPSEASAPTLEASTEAKKRIILLGSPSNSLPSEIYEKLDIIIDIYVTLINLTYVPNVTHEIKFLLNILYLIHDLNCSCVVHQETLKELNILKNIEEWKYFCLEALLKQESMLFKLDFMSRNFLARAIKNNSQVLQRNCPPKFLEKLCLPNLNPIVRPIHFLKTLESGKSESYFQYEDHHMNNAQFKSIEKSWCSHFSEDELNNDLRNLCNDSNTMALYSFGKIFVHNLVSLVEDNCDYKNDHEKKVVQLSTRIVLPKDAEDKGFTIKELFYKLVVDFCLKYSQKHIFYLKYWLYRAIKVNISVVEPYREETESESRSYFLFGLKLKITLAKFLGYIEFYDLVNCSQLPENDRALLASMHSEFSPSIDLKKFVLRAVKQKQISETVPWIVQFLCMADRIILLQKYYYDIFFMLLSFYVSQPTKHDREETQKFGGKQDNLVKLTIIIPDSSNICETDNNADEALFILIKESAMVFIKLWIGKLFDSKILGEDNFFEIFNAYIEKLHLIKFKGCVQVRRASDCLVEIGPEMFLELCPHFSKLKHWDAPRALPTTRNIRPILLKTNLSQNANDTQLALEDQFLKENPNVSDIIDFVNQRILLMFKGDISRNIFEVPSATQIGKSEFLSKGYLSESIDEITSSCRKRIVESLKNLIPPDCNETIYSVSISLAIRQFEREIFKWMVSMGIKKDAAKNCFSATNGNSLNVIKSNKMDCSVDSLSSNMSSFFISISENIRKLWLEEGANQDVHAVLNEILTAADKLKEVKEHKMLEDLYMMSWDYVLDIIVLQPQLVYDGFFENVCSFWRKNNHGDVEHRILCPRTVYTGSMNNKDVQKLSAKHVAKLIYVVCNERMLSSDQLETELVSVLRNEWTMIEIEFLLLILSEIKDILPALNFDISGTLECVAVELNSIKTMEEVLEH